MVIEAQLAAMSPVILLVVLFIATLFIYVPVKALFVGTRARENSGYQGLILASELEPPLVRKSTFIGKRQNLRYSIPKVWLEDHGASILQGKSHAASNCIDIELTSRSLGTARMCSKRRERRSLWCRHVSI